MAQEPLIDQPFLEKLERLALRWQRSFPGLVGGRNPSRFAGSGQEFLDHRHFHHGDDLRAVNWRAYLRFEKLFLKMFRVEPRTPVRLLLDSSRSMATGAAPKFRYAQRLAAALCYISLVRLDTIFLQPFSDRLGEPFRGGGGRHRFAPAVEFLSALAPAGRTDYFHVARQFIDQCPRGGLLIILSDFLDDAGCERPLQFLADLDHELLLIQLWADEDREPPWDGELELEDAETDGRLELSFDAAARLRYTAAFDKFSKDIRRLALGNGGRYAGLSTSMSIEEAVFGPLLEMGGVA
jgi:uncharacterized protein (DUF58 family)